MQIGVNEVAYFIHTIRQQNGGIPHIQFDYSDHRVAWHEFGACSARGPTLDVGQRGDCRWSFSDGSALHAHWFDEVVRFHIDRIDPGRDPVGHVMRDTNIVEGAVLGALAGGAASTKRPLLGAFLGLVAGALGGGAVTAARATVYRIDRAAPDGSFQASPIGGIRIQA